MKELFDIGEAFEPTLKTALKSNIYTKCISVDCVHTCETYSVEVGKTNDCDKHTLTYFRLNVLDDGIDGERKEIEFIMQGEAERGILINLLKVAVLLLEDGDVRLTLVTDQE